MVTSRAATAIVGLAATLLVSAVAWYYFETALLFLFVPFVPFLFTRRDGDEVAARRVCPTCGFSTSDPGFAFCPRDGTELE